MAPGTRIMTSRPNPSLLSPVNVSSSVLEEFQNLQYGWFTDDVGRKLTSIAVCKTHAGEGSSTVAFHLSVAMARNPRLRVVLVDGDLSHPSLHGLLQLSQANGLYEALGEGAETTKERIKQTALPNLFLFASGKPLDSHPVFFDASGFAEILAILKTSFSIVIVDTPPVLSSNLAPVMAGQCDGSLLVVQAERTRWEEAQEAQARLQRAGAHLLGVVLNRRKHYIPNFLYKRL